MSGYIPFELIPNILARLPVEDVLRCTSVCKSWYELITSPSFASLHLNLSSPNQEPRVLANCDRGEDAIYCLQRDNQTFDEIAKLDTPVTSSDNEWRIIDCLNGLVCLYEYNVGKIVLWNPSLRKSIILPNSRVLLDPPETVNQTIGFGFVATSNEYKIIRCTYLYQTVPQSDVYELSTAQSDVYELSTGSWRDLKPGEFLDLYAAFPQSHLNGILHWYAYNPKKVNSTFSRYICSFDLRTEKFGTLMVPSCLRKYADDDDVGYCFLSTLKESLSLIEFDNGGLCRIWVMNEYGIADSWQKLFTINAEHHLIRFRYYRDNGEILFTKYDPSYGIQTLVSYDYKNDLVKNDGIPADCLYISIHTYVESLVLIKGTTEVKIDEESTNISKNIQGLLLI